jgi:hypothetical protein
MDTKLLYDRSVTVPSYYGVIYRKTDNQDIYWILLEQNIVDDIMLKAYRIFSATIRNM